VFRPGDPELIVNAILGMLIWVYERYRPERHTEAVVTDVFWQRLGGGLIARSNRSMAWAAGVLPMRTRIRHRLAARLYAATPIRWNFLGRPWPRKSPRALNL
jgi:hypothetical protein